MTRSRDGSRGALVFTILTRLSMTGSTALVAVVLAYSVGKDGIGLFGILRALPALVLLVTELGTSVASPYLINNQKVPAQQVLSNALAWSLIIGLVDLAAWCALSPIIAKYLLRGVPLFWVCAAGMLVCLGAIESAMHNVLRSLRSFRAANLMRGALEVSILLAMTIAAATHSLTNLGIVKIVIALDVLPVLFGTIRLMSLGLRPTPTIDRNILSRAIRFGIRSQVGIAMNLLNFRLDHLILSSLTNLGTVGLYVVATKTAEFFRVLPAAFAYVLEPKFAADSHSNATTTAKRLAWVAFGANLSIMVVAFFVGPLIIPVFFDAWSEETIPVFRILVVGLATLGAHGVFAAYNLGQNKPQLTTYAVTLGLLVTVILDITLVPRFQAVGAAIASSITYTVTAASLFFFFQRGTHAS